MSSGLDVTAVGRSESLAGSIDLAGPSEFTVDLTTFVSDQNRRDNRVRDIFADDPIARFTTSELTLPEDYTEGLGQGEKLNPQSLYEDQLIRRLERGDGLW